MMDSASSPAVVKAATNNNSNPNPTLDSVLLHEDTNDQFIRRLMSSMVQATQASNALPTESDYQFHRSTNKEFVQQTSAAGAKVVGLISSLSRFVLGTDGNLSDDFQDPAIYNHVVDLIDKLLEDADIQFDHVTGRSKIGAKLVSTVHQSLAVDKDKLLRSNLKDIPKPQLAFLSEIDNARDRPFRPRILTKPHQLVPLDLTERKLPAASLGVGEAEVVMPAVYYPHPYEYELKKLKYQEWQLEDPNAVASRLPSANQPFDFIEHEDDFHRMVDELQYCREVAIDLEHHSYHSFQGFTCLMQVSSREKDYVVDVLALRSILQAINTVTANPAIVKVFHGCESDIFWLQKDFGVYVVNCFDTYNAASLLRYPALSLAHLMKVFCNVTANKKHQLADWRQRPLPAELIQYAKDDTHYLLHIYDCIRRDVWKEHSREGIEIVLNMSKVTCQLRYEKEFFWPLGYRKLLGVGSNAPVKNLSNAQDGVMARVWDWRDLKARELDESMVAVMSNAELIRIATLMPRSVKTLLEECAPLSDTVREHAQDIVGLVNQQLDIGPALAVLPPSSSGAAGIGTSTARHNQSKGGNGRSTSSNSGKALAFVESTGDNDSNNRLYGRALHTPSKEIYQAFGGGAMTPSPVTVAPSSNGDGSALLYQPYNHSTVLTMQPQPRGAPPLPLVLPTTSASGSGLGNREGEAPSPLISHDEVFVMAHWNSGLSLSKGNTRYGSHPDSEEMDDNIERLTRSQNDAAARNQEIQSRLYGTVTASTADSDSANQQPPQKFIGGVSATQQQALSNTYGGIPGEGDDNDDDDAPDDDCGMDEEKEMLSKLPASFSEIYAISNNIRRQNREKKRNRDGPDDQPSSNTGTQLTIHTDLDGPKSRGKESPSKTSSNKVGSASAAASSAAALLNASLMGATNFDESFYFNYAKEHAGTGDRDIDSTLDIAQSVGWIANEQQRQDVKQSYVQEQMSGAGDDDAPPQSGRATGGGGGGDGTEGPLSSGMGNPMRRSFDRESTGVSGGKASGGKPQQQQQKQHQQSGVSPKVFDYSKSSHSSIGAFHQQIGGDGNVAGAGGHTGNKYHKAGGNPSPHGGAHGGGGNRNGPGSAGRGGGPNAPYNPYVNGSKKR